MTADSPKPVAVVAIRQFHAQMPVAVVSPLLSPLGVGHVANRADNEAHHLMATTATRISDLVAQSPDPCVKSAPGQPRTAKEALMATPRAPNGDTLATPAVANRRNQLSDGPDAALARILAAYLAGTRLAPEDVETVADACGGSYSFESNVHLIRRAGRTIFAAVERLPERGR